AASASAVVSGSGSYNWSSTPQLVADVQGWVDDPATNFGWIVIGEESVLQTARKFASREGSASQRPRLAVTFTPPAENGACCFDDGTCSPLLAAACDDAGGSYQGDGTDCDPNECPQPTGACCLPDETCQVDTAAACDGQGGSYQGDGTTCVPDPCANLVGACCFSGGACSELGATACAEAGGQYQGDGTSCTPGLCPLALEPYVDRLPIPGAIAPVGKSDEGVPIYEVAMTELQQQLHRDLAPTTVWAYGSGFPGPVIEATVGEPLQVRWINDLRGPDGALRTEHYLPVDTCAHGANDASPRAVVHLHGGHVPAEVDGYPEDAYLPGNEVTYEYPNDQPPAMIWFHDHALGITRLNVYMGLAGLYVLRDEVEAALGLPDGPHEVPLVIQDRSFNADGSLAYPESWVEHFFGEYVLVNGKVWPYHEVERGKHRLRLLNGSNARTYTLTFQDAKGAAPFVQIGTDGGLLPAPVPLTELSLSPGERADLVFDFAGYADGDVIELVNSAPAPFPGEPGAGVVPEVMQFRVTAAEGHTDPLPARLRPVEPLLEDDARFTRTLELRKEAEPCAGSRWLINGLVWDQITEYPLLGSTEVWTFVNRSGVSHPMHLHLDFFQVLDRQAFELDGDEIVPIGDPVPPPPNEAGWKDTAQVGPFEILRVVAQFDDYPGKYAYHCHILEHEDHEMMRQFHVVDCPADTDGNGAVDVDDLVTVILGWGGDGSDDNADIDGSGLVDVDDLVEVILSWGPCVEDE
ncbi:MAG: multicopper oxidase domain-containing protein, partial [Planctomycetota bacterium]